MGGRWAADDGHRTLYAALRAPARAALLDDPSASNVQISRALGGRPGHVTIHTIRRELEAAQDIHCHGGYGYRPPLPHSPRCWCLADREVPDLLSVLIAFCALPVAHQARYERQAAALLGRLPQHDLLAAAAALWAGLPMTRRDEAGRHTTVQADQRCGECGNLFRSSRLVTCCGRPARPVMAR